MLADIQSLPPVPCIVQSGFCRLSFALGVLYTSDVESLTFCPVQVCCPVLFIIAVLRLEVLIKDGRINIGDNNLLKMHLLNSAIKISEERGRGRLVKLNPKLHIDGTAALLCAMTMRNKYYLEYEPQFKNED